ncbi:MAG TPA: 6-carboxytetrahydropterin synthase [Bryobacteraceae bacterium]|jgi:6-pyruvoyltetrahydropterin/6-carboxytetrahydropterin synthase|nr:6-carboxytetrahydropterin synthase [Bryobacteraceae bacterium]
MFVTRKVEFSASHVCRVPEFSEQENRRLYGQEASPNGHGHNYILEVTVEGDPDPVTGMVIDLKKLKDILEDQIVTPMDHRFLNAEVKPFDQIVPTPENIAGEIWQRLSPILNAGRTSLHRIRLFETADLYVDITRSEEG